RQIKPVAQTAEQEFELRRRQRRRGSAAEKNGLRLDNETLGELLRFTQERLAKTLRLRGIGALLVEGAIRADPSAKRNVNVKMPDRLCRSTLDVGRWALDVCNVAPKLGFTLHCAHRHFSLFFARR